MCKIYVFKHGAVPNICLHLCHMVLLDLLPCIHLIIFLKTEFSMKINAFFRLSMLVMVFASCQKDITNDSNMGGVILNN